MENTETVVRVPLRDPVATSKRVAGDILAAVGLPIDSCRSLNIVLEPGQPACLDVRYFVRGEQSESLAEVVKRYQFVEPADISSPEEETEGEML